MDNLTPPTIIEAESVYQKLYDGIMDSIPSSILILDPHLKVLAANTNFYQKSHRNERDTLGQSINNIFPKVLLDYTIMADKIRIVFQSNIPYEGEEMEYRAPGLPARVYYYRLTPLEKSTGEVESVILLMDDVTERKRLGEQIQRAEEHLAQVVNSANDLIVSTDAGGKIVSWNPTIEKVTGILSRKVLSKPFEKIFLKNSHKEINSIVKRILNGVKVRDKEFPLMTIEEELVDVSWSFSAIKDEQGRTNGMVALGRDLTERKELEARLAQSAKMASLGTMAGGVAHEIRNPLAIIDASAQVIKNREANSGLLNDCVKKIRDASTRASNIVDNMLKFAREPEFEMQEINIHNILHETLELMQNQLSLQHLKVDLKFQADKPTILGNQNQLQQVYVNLILNACNATEPGGTISLSTQKKGRMLECRFSDTGKGIPPKDLPYIFDPFFTTQPVGKGTGLGLSVSYSIIERHNGSINVESQRGKGTQFTITLPLHKTQK